MIWENYLLSSWLHYVDNNFREGPLLRGKLLTFWDASPKCIDKTSMEKRGPNLEIETSKFPENSFLSRVGSSKCNDKTSKLWQTTNFLDVTNVNNVYSWKRRNFEMKRHNFQIIYSSIYPSMKLWRCPAPLFVFVWLRLNWFYLPP